jgi:PAS domain S-box-containing protein
VPVPEGHNGDGEAAETTGPVTPCPSMLSATAALHFAVELLGMLVAATGLALVVLRAGTARPAWIPLLMAGFAVLGAAAFLRGSLLVSDPGRLALVRLAGAVLLGIGVPGWAAGSRSRALLAVGAALTAAGAAVEVAGGAGIGGDEILAAADLAVAAGLYLAARRSIAARVAASSATTLLVVVLALSVALSAVIANTVERDHLVALGDVARIDAGQVANRQAEATSSAEELTASIEERFPRRRLAQATPARLRGVLEALAPGFSGEDIAYLPTGSAVVAPPRSQAVAAAALRALRSPARCSRLGGLGAATVSAVGRSVVAVAEQPVCLLGQLRSLGAALVVDPLRPSALAGLRDPPGATVELVSAGRPLVAAGDALPAAAVAALHPGQAPRRLGDRLVAAAGIRGTGVELVVATPVTGGGPGTLLVRTLFVIALGGTVLALGLAVLTGDRITAGLRRLTTVAERVQAGSVSERAGLVSDDELGVLASAFDAMVASVEEHGFALRAAADVEARLRDRLEAVVAGMGDALVAFDTGGRITDFNRAAESLTGVGAEEALGRPVEEVVVVDGGFAALQADAPASTPPLELSAADGSVVPVSASVGELRSPTGHPAGTVLVLRDLRREEELERMKTEFLSRIGHELRTPLTGILGYAEILARREVSGAQTRAWNAEIVAAARRQLRVIGLLEFFAATGAGRATPRSELLDPARLVEEVAAEWVARAGARHPVTTRLVRRLPAVLGDRRWLGLALDEVVDNAVKFSPDGGRVLISVRPAPGGVEIAVRDHGLGMSAGEREIAFGTFAQGDTSDTRRFGGLGLGLPFVQRVVAAHGGTVSARPARSGGTVVRLRIPSADQAPAPPSGSLRAS